MNVLGTTRVLGVFGHPVEHSLSPVMHNAALRALNLDYVYVPFHVLPAKLGEAVEAIRALSLAGVNVTIPHKERVIPFLDEVSETAQRTGSVNTIIHNHQGRLVGDTTDGSGFLRSIEVEWGRVDGCRALILGAGGSAKAVAFALADIGCELVIANRTFARAEELSRVLNATYGRTLSRAVELEREALAVEAKRVDLLVNSTSLGMHPNVDSTPIPKDLLHSRLLIYDLVYNPLETRLTREAKASGARAMNGLKMLIYQGAVSFEMWTGCEAPVDIMEKAAMEKLAAESSIRAVNEVRLS